MGVPWLPQVRFLHFGLFLLALVTLFLYAAYLNTDQLQTTVPPTRSLMNSELRAVQENASHAEQINSLTNSLASLTNSLTSGLTSDNPVAPLAVHSVNNNNIVSINSSNSSSPDLTRGIAAELIYEAGHVDISQPVCPEKGKNIKLLICVTSAPSHEKGRLAIRETWGHFAMRKDISIAFMLGSTSDQAISKKLDIEHELYGDIIRGKFIDTYDNLTLKTISMLEWVDMYCPQAAFVLKTDDDMFINVSRLLAFLAKHKPDQRAIYGRLAKKWKPIRNKKSKYYISPQQYKPSVFPDFTTGPAYVFPAQISKDLYVAALNHTYFKLEDVFVTGIVANGLKIKRIHAPEFLNKKVSFTSCNIQKGISFHMVKSTEQYDLWKKLHDAAKCKT